jgi:hypothetical protein
MYPARPEIFARPRLDVNPAADCPAWVDGVTDDCYSVGVVEPETSWLS